MTRTLDERAGQIVEQTLDVPTADRPAAVAAACGGDGPLLARVQSLLSALPQIDRFMADATVGPGPMAVAAVGERPGDTVGRYKLLEQIGEGGFGIVFTAEQQRPVRRLVALKVIKLGMDTKEVVARFEAERQALALMDHPNIAKVLDAGATDAGRPYFVMELVRGLPITEYADKHRMSTAQRVALAAQVCRAVQHAHQKGVIHRDLKPTNVLVTTADDKPVPKVIDFGIAKATQARLTDHTLYTAHRQLIGTPQYMSPEQADSEGADLDTRSDVYSLGVLTYELLVGTTPFDARVLRSAAFEAMRRMIRDTDVPRPATRLHTLAADSQSAIAASRSTDVRRLAEAVRGELDWIVMKALEKDRTRRYDTAAALADDLTRYLDGEAVLAGPATAAYRLRKLARRYRAAVAVGGAIAAVLLLGVVGTAWGLVREAKQHRLADTQRVLAEQRQAEADRLWATAVAAEQRATDQAAVAEARRREAVSQGAEAARQRDLAAANERRVRDEQAATAATLKFLTDDVLAKASPVNTRDEKVGKVLVDTVIEPALKTVDVRFADQPLIRAGIQESLARTLYNLDRADLGRAAAKAAMDARRRVQGDDHPDTLKATSTYAGFLVQTDEVGQGEQLLKHVWEADRRLLGDDHPDTRSAQSTYAGVLYLEGRCVEAEQLYRPLYEASRQASDDGRGDPDKALLSFRLMGAYGAAVFRLHRYADAERLMRQAWEGDKRVAGEDHPSTLIELCGYADAVRAQFRYAEAEGLAKQAWELSRRVHGDDHHNTRLALMIYAGCVDAQGRHVEAVGLLRQEYDARRRTSGDDDPATLAAMAQFGAALADLHSVAEAADVLRRSWDDHRRVLGDDRGETLETMDRYGRALLELGRNVEAAAVFQELVDRRRRTARDDDPMTLDALNSYGVALARQGHADQSADLFKRVWEARRRTLGEGNFSTVTALGNYAGALVVLGRQYQAVPLLKQAWDWRRRVQGDDHPETLLAEYKYASTVADGGGCAEAESLLKQVWEAQRRELGDGHPDALNTLNNYAGTVFHQGRFGDAAQLYQQAWVVSRLTHEADDRFTLTALSNYAAAVSSQGRFAESVRLYKQCWDTCRRVLGEGDPLTTLAGRGYAEDQASLGRMATSAPATRPGDSVADLATAMATTAVAAATNARGRAAALAAGHHAADAEPLYRRAVDLARAAGPADRADLAADLLDWGDCLRHLGRTAEAEPPVREAVAILRADRGPTEKPRLDGERRFAGLLLSLDKTDEAVATYRAAVAADDAGHVDPYWTSNDRMDLAKALEKAGDPAGAEAALRRAVAIRQAVPKWGHTGRDTQAAARRLAAVLDREGKGAEAAAVRADAGLGPATRP